MKEKEENGGKGPSWRENSPWGASGANSSFDGFYVEKTSCSVTKISVLFGGNPIVVKSVHFVQSFRLWADFKSVDSKTHTHPTTLLALPTKTSRQHLPNRLIHFILGVVKSFWLQEREKEREKLVERERRERERKERERESSS